MTTHDDDDDEVGSLTEVMMKIGLSSPLNLHRSDSKFVFI